MENQTESVIADLIENEPTVNETVVEALTQSSVESEAKHESVATENERNKNVSPTMEPFDPAIHEVNADGTPRLTAKGGFRRKRGRKTGSNGNVGTSGPKTAPSSDSASVNSETRTVDFTQTGKFLAGLLFGTCQGVFDQDEWEPGPDERLQIETSFVNFCQANQWGDLPPGIALTLCVGLYAIPRINMPKTRERMSDMMIAMGMRKKVKNTAQSQPNPNPNPNMQPQPHPSHGPQPQPQVGYRSL